MTRLLRTCVPVIAVLCFAAGVAHARDDEANAAREHYKRGTTLYDLGKYDDAIVEFQQAYELRDDPVLLYNIAQAHRLSNRYSDALRFYRTYLRRSPSARNREDVEQKIQDMETLLATQSRVMTSPPSEAIPPRGDKPATGIGRLNEPKGYTPPPPPPTSEPEPKSKVAVIRPPPPPPLPATEPEVPTTPETPAVTETPVSPETPRVQTREEVVRTEEKPVDTPRSGRGRLVGGLVVAAVGVAAAGGGLAMGLLAMNESSRQEQSQVFLPEAESNGKLYTMLSYVGYGAGGALLIAGLIVAGTGGSSESEKPSARSPVSARPLVVPAVGPGYAGASLRLSF